MGLCGVSHFPPWQHKNKINKAGELVLTSESSRYQFRNLAECLQKIRDMIAEASQLPKEPSKEDAQLQRLRYRGRVRGGRVESRSSQQGQWRSCREEQGADPGSGAHLASADWAALLTPPQLPALKSTDCSTSGLIGVFCFQDRKHESGKTAAEKNKLFHKDEQEGDCGLKSPHCQQSLGCHAVCREPPYPGSLARTFLRRGGYRSSRAAPQLSTSFITGCNKLVSTAVSLTTQSELCSRAPAFQPKAASRRL